MTIPPQTNQDQTPAPTSQNGSKEDNLVMMRRKYERDLANERAARELAEKEVQRLGQERQGQRNNEDDESDEPYVDHKRLDKKLAKFGEKAKQETKTEIQQAVQTALHEERKQNWFKQNPDFHEVMSHAQKLADQDPDLADAILEMPEGFERQKLVYKTVKKLNLHKPESKQPSIQEKVDANRRSPYYQPSGVGTSPYSSHGDFSPQGQKSAYDKMQELKKRLSI